MMWLLMGGGGSSTPVDEFGDEFGWKKFKEGWEGAIKDAFDPERYQTFFVKINTESKKLSRELANNTTYTKSFELNIYNAMKNAQDLGLTMAEASDYIQSFADATGKIPQIQTEVLENTKALSLLTGISVKEIAGYTAEFQKIGMGQEQAQKNLVKTYATARAYGVNAAKLTKDVQSQLEKAATVQFKNGVEGLTKMAARAQQLGIDFKQIMKIGDDALDPDKAIEMASGMQMLGGNVGALGDPFKLLYMAQNDLGALQDEFIKVTAASAEYNEQTGEFKIGTQQMYRMKQMAQELGISYEDVQRSAIAAAKESKILSETQFSPNMTEEDRKLVSSMAERKDGKWQIQIPGSDKWVDISNMSADQINSIKEQQELMNQTDGEKLGNIDQTLKLMKGIAETSLSVGEKQVNEMRKLANTAIFSDKAGGKEILKDEKDPGSMLNNITERIKIIEKTRGELENAVTDFVVSLNKLLGRMTTSMNDYFIAGNTPYIGTDITKILSEVEKITSSFVGFGTSTYNDAYFAEGTAKISTGFGQLLPMPKFNPKDQFLAAPNISEFVNSSVDSFKVLGEIQNMDQSKIQTLQDLLTKNVDLENLSNVVNVNNNTTNEVKGNVGVNGDVKIKVEGLQGSLAQILDSDPNFQRMFKENVMNIINERLSKSYGEKLGNLS